jgi:hypothetical protein
MHRYSSYFNVIILFVVGILPLYAINLNDVSMFTDLSFIFLVILNMWLYDVLHPFNVHCFVFVRKKEEDCFDFD